MTVTRQWQPRPSDTFIPDLRPSDTFVPNLCTVIITYSACSPRPSGDSDDQAMTSQPSEVQIIFDDALTDLNASSTISSPSPPTRRVVSPTE